MLKLQTTSHFLYHTASRFGALHPEIADAHAWLRRALGIERAKRIIDKNEGMPPEHWRRVIATIQQELGANQRRRQVAQERPLWRRGLACPIDNPGLPAELPGGTPGDRGRGGCDSPRATDADSLPYLIDDPKAVALDLDPETDTIETRVERYAKLRIQAQGQAAYIAGLDRKAETASGHDVLEIARTMGLCGSFLVFHRYDEIGENRLHAAKFCQHGRLCAFCSMRRMVRKVARIVPIAYQAMIESGTVGMMVTLTVKNGSDLGERFAHLRDCDRRLHERGKNRRKYELGQLKRKQRDTTWKHVLGQLWSVEVKQGADSGLWHPHMHSLVLCDQPLDSQALSAEWRELTGDSFIVDVRPLHAMELIESGAGIESVRDQLAADLMEVISYALKFSSMGPARTWEAFKAVYGKQLSRTRGLLRGLDVKDEYLDAPLAVEDMPFVEVIAKWAGDHYTLQAADHWPSMGGN